MDNDFKLIEQLIVEELTRDDKAEIRQIINRELDKKLKSKEVKDMIEDEIIKSYKKPDTKEEVAEIAKKVLKTLYRDMSLKHPYMIDRIKVR
jgi:RecJ-like exonuclease|tara:strand:+ start:972 stop:1247 length:276 start_codon:yes stop_codon:yes gene_type:complete